MEKGQLRERQLRILTEFSQTKEKQQEDEILTAKFLQSPLLKNAQKIGLTLSLPLEVDTSEIIAQLWVSGKEVYLPRCLPERQMEFTKFTYQTKLTMTRFGVKENHEPDAIVDNNLDLVVVPLLAYGQDQSARLGFGGGYYDRFLAERNLTTVSLVNSKQLFQHTIWSIEQTDIPIKNYITI
ncbi:5-formyltetrahydrofolate cyclo-ligase [Lactobacillus colini]|uniref:5-formyltetrahydrofolate cyclo-ligase n=1 Tax=Lactobacillus colini TaxID=1819254 RepID=A0ABS4MBT9_9LACO|nr:5-formyltetrahydrofolate cyclo-ligase [Lactobacillus colini]MBP2056882.1 5-formyltetrahydrofolate cyclo-ligase [Lactobacillus colini]